MLLVAKLVGFFTPTEDAVTVNIGSYVSASSTFTLNDAGSLSVTVDDTATLMVLLMPRELPP